MFNKRLTQSYGNWKISGDDLFFHVTFHSIYKHNTYIRPLFKNSFIWRCCEHIFVGLLYLNQVKWRDPFCSLLLLIKVWLKFLFRCKRTFRKAVRKAFRKLCRIYFQFSWIVFRIHSLFVSMVCVFIYYAHKTSKSTARVLPAQIIVVVIL